MMCVAKWCMKALLSLLQYTATITTKSQKASNQFQESKPTNNANSQYLIC